MISFRLLIKQTKRISLIGVCCFAMLLLQSCNNPKSLYILLGGNATQTERMAAHHLKSDLQRVSGNVVHVINEHDELPSNGLFFILGTLNTNEIVKALSINEKIELSESFPGKRGGIRKKLKLADKHEAIVLAGVDIQGCQYAVYNYCEEILGIDPFEYWTGELPAKKTLQEVWEVEDKVIQPPVIPILCYFENDVDELANLKEPLLEYDWRSYTEMINSLVRIKYNAIQLFDMLGRPEFYQREEYKRISPDYNVRISFIDSMIDYAHAMGMLVQVDLSLGYKFRPMMQEHADCWTEYRDKWIENWQYYFEQTPIGKADLFSLRPRNQVWDWEYKSTCGEDKIDVFNSVYYELGNLIDQYKPEAKKIAICYSDGMTMFNNGFNPPKDWIIVWCDDGWGGFDILPTTTKGYKFGTYMHAGYWLNHTVHDPYPEKIDSVMRMMSNMFEANSYCEVNGQQFRPFILNIEAFSKVADNPDTFDGKQFYKDWAQRYFGEEAAPYAIQSMQFLHKAQFDNVGYVEHLWEIREAVAYLSNGPIERPGKLPIPFDYKRVEDDYEALDKRFNFLEQALEKANQGKEFVSEDNMFYHDFIQLPVHLYLDLLEFENCLHKMAKHKRTFEESGDSEQLEKAIALLERANEALDTIYARSMKGDKNKQWKGWYNPIKRRPNNGFPSVKMLQAIEANLKSMR